MVMDKKLGWTADLLGDNDNNLVKTIISQAKAFLFVVIGNFSFVFIFLIGEVSYLIQHVCLP